MELLIFFTLKEIQQFLINKGFKPYTKTHKRFPTQKDVLDNGDIVYFYSYQYKYSKHLNTNNTFSSMVEGGIDIRYIKDDIEIVFGLHEKGKPPTLISPRPYIYKNGFISCIYKDDIMNRILMNESCENIFNAMFNKDKALTIQEQIKPTFPKDRTTKHQEG